MSQVATKSIILSQPKATQGDVSMVPNLPSSTTTNETFSEVKVEIPGVDPSTVSVDFEDGSLFIRCESGVLEIPVDPTVNLTKVKADILWGMLTLVIPHPDQPAPRSIKIGLHDVAKKAPTKFTEED
jgi:HSP20 family molecular chaperone IbpA